MELYTTELGSGQAYTNNSNNNNSKKKNEFNWKAPLNARKTNSAAVVVFIFKRRFKSKLKSNLLQITKSSNKNQEKNTTLTISHDNNLMSFSHLFAKLKKKELNCPWKKLRPSWDKILYKTAFGVFLIILLD